MSNKVAAVCDSILSNRTDLFIITESWINDNNGGMVDADFDSSMDGYTTQHVQRSKRRGGGICLVSRTNIKIKMNNSGVFKTFEYMDTNIQSGNEI